MAVQAAFNSEDACGKINLWVTDGTPAGTSELTLPGGINRGFLVGCRE